MNVRLFIFVYSFVCFVLFCLCFLVCLFFFIVLFLLCYVYCQLSGQKVISNFYYFQEFWRNPEEFPSSFFKGSWEGFWWAFVSMTTVG